MIYINNELQTNWRELPEGRNFQDKYKSIIDQGTGRLKEPFTIKYVDSLVKPDPNNPGKKIQPRSIGLSLFATGMVNRQPANIRYSERYANIDPKTGQPVYTQTSVDVVDGRFTTLDLDLAFFFSEFSNQNAGNVLNEGNPRAVLQVENVAAERAALAAKKRDKAIIENRLWGSPQEGGLSDDRIRDVAKLMMIPNVDSISDINEVKLYLERLMSMAESNKVAFLDFSNFRNDDQSIRKERRSIVADAIESGKIHKDSVKCAYFLAGEDKPLWKFKIGTKDANEKLYLYLENERPDIIEQLIKNSEAMKSIAQEV